MKAKILIKKSFFYNKYTYFTLSALLLLFSFTTINYIIYDKKNFEILSAVENGRLNEVKNLIRANADPNCYKTNLLKDNLITQFFYKTKGHFTLLMIAVSRNDLLISKEIIGAGGDVNAKYYNGNIWTSALLYATSNGNTDIVRILLDHGANVNFDDGDNRIILNYALSSDNIEMVRCLLDHKASLIYRGFNGRTPLYDAIRWGNIKIVKLLLDRGADPEAKDSEGKTPLTYTSSFNKEILIILKAAIAQKHAIPVKHH